MKTVLIAANPKSGKKDRNDLVLALAAQLKLHGLHAEVVRELSILESRIGELFGSGDLLTVVAAGGDGTVSAIATRTPPEVPIAVFPLGSENLLAQYFSIGCNPSRCAEMIANQHVSEIDAMEIHGKVALLMSSIGYDADVVRRVHQNRKSHITRWAYRYQTLRAWFSYRWPRFEVTIHHDLQSFEKTNICKYSSQWCFVFNIPRYAAGISILDHCDPGDGLLDIGLFETSGPIKGFSQFFDVMRGTHVRRKDWHHLSGSQVDLRLLDGSRNGVGVQFDGEWSGELPVTIRVLPKRIKLIQTGATVPA